MSLKPQVRQAYDPKQKPKLKAVPHLSLVRQKGGGGEATEEEGLDGKRDSKMLRKHGSQLWEGASCIWILMSRTPIGSSSVRGAQQKSTA